MLRLIAVYFLWFFAGNSYAYDFIAKIKIPGYLSAMAFNRRTPNSYFIKKTGILHFHIKDVNSGSIARDYLKSYIDEENISYIVPNSIVKAEIMPNQPEVTGQWFHSKINSMAAWEVTEGNPNVIVAILDTGVDYNHPDLWENIFKNRNEIPDNGYDDDGNGFIDDFRGYDFVRNNPDPYDRSSYYNPGQGTHIAGLVAGMGHNDYGVRGVAALTKIMPVRVLDEYGKGTILNAARGIDYAVSMGAKVIVAGWTAQLSREDAKPLEEAISRARQRGVVIVAAAGNGGKSIDGKEIFPANYSFYDVISVSSTNDRDERPVWSNFGTAYVSMAAPGENILSTLPNGNYGRFSGTPLSAGIVAGVSALVLAERDVSPGHLKAILQSAATPKEVGTQCQCIVDAYKAVTERGEYILPSLYTMNVGETRRFQTSSASSTWEISDHRLATIDQNGILTAKRPGKLRMSIVGDDTVKSAEIYIKK